MKKFFSVAVLLFVATALVAGNALAGTGIPGSGWWSGEIVQNVGTATTTIELMAYDQSATPVTYSASQSVAAGAQFNVSPSNFTGMPDGFQGSAVVSAGQPIKAIVNITNRLNGSLGITGGKAAAQYQGIDSTMVDETLYFPTAKGAHFTKTTTFYIQNAGTAAATATATFTMRNGDVHTLTTAPIGPNQMVVFSVFDTATFNPSTNDGRIGALKVESTQPLAGVVVEHFDTEPVATVAQATRAFTAAEFSTKAYAPLVKNNRNDANGYPRWSGINVQNVGSSTITITVTYTARAGGGCSAGATFTDTKTADAGKAATFNQQTGQSNFPADCAGAATIEATGNIVATVSEAYASASVPSWGQRYTTYSAIPSVSATTKLAVPLFKDDRLSKRSALQIQNVGSAAATNVVATFVCTGGSSFTAISNPLTVNAGDSLQFIHPSAQASLFTGANPFAAANVTCAVTVTSDQPVVAMVNEAALPGFDQDNNNFEAFNLP